MTEKKTFVADDPDLDAKPFPISVEYRKFTGPEDPETGLRPSERIDEEFLCRPFVNAGVLFLIDAANSNRQQLAHMVDMFDAAIVPTDLPRFREMVDGEDSYVTGKVLGQIVAHLYEVYTARPTRPPAGISDG